MVYEDAVEWAIDNVPFEDSDFEEWRDRVFAEFDNAQELFANGQVDIMLSKQWLGIHDDIEDQSEPDDFDIFGDFLEAPTIQPERPTIVKEEFRKENIQNLDFSFSQPREQTTAEKFRSARKRR